MTKFRTIPAALVTATLLATTGFAAPAVAGGQISIAIEPKNEEERQAMRFGLGLYAFAKAIESDAYIEQNGNGNAAGIAQSGNGSFGVIEQDGDGHTATLNQQGDNQAFGIFQIGEGAEGHVDQQIDGDTGLLLQIGF
ncbi:MAG: curlin [Rhodobacteraceae bacterium]|nr:curlin [Paracoccaceae bacterium]